jgi:ribosomal protein S12 methylthiotransferase accessory factor YcaO
MRCNTEMTGTDILLLERALESLNGKFDVVELPIHECPVFLAIAVPVHSKITGLKSRLPAGRGLSRVQAMLSAAAEASELLSTLTATSDFVTVEDGVAKVSATRLSDGALISIPAQDVFLDWATEHGEPLTFDADSTGCAAGQNLDDATERALFECVERDAFAVWWYGQQSRQHLPLSYVDMIHPRIAWWLDQRLRRTVLIDITSDLGVPVYAAVSCEPEGSKIAVGTAAGPQTSSTLLSAITEMIQIEVSMDIGATPENHILAKWLGGADFNSLKQFTALDGLAQERRLVGSTTSKLQSAGHPILRVDLTKVGDVFSTVRIITPQLCKMDRRFFAHRIIANAQLHPEYNGATDEREFETLEPY